MRHKSEFGVGNIYSLQIATEKEGDTKTGKPRVGQLAFGEEISFTQLSKMFSDGAEIRGTKLTDEFGFDEYYKKYFRAVSLFAINPRGKLFVYTADKDLKPAAGWTIISLSVPVKENGIQKVASKANTHSGPANNLP